MERIHALIEQLHQQGQQNSNPAQLLLTVQLLQSELLKLQQRNGTLGTAKVAVTLPVNMNFSEEMVRTQKPAPQAEAPAPAPVAQAPAAIPEPISPYAPREYVLNKPREVVQEAPEPADAVAQQVPNPAPIAVAE